MGKIFEKTEQLDLFGNTKEENLDKTLLDKFLIPPFSVFDCRQGYWQSRKRIWLSLGIKSELGRDSKCFHMEDWAKQKGKTSLMGASDISIFDPVLCEVCYKWFNIEHGHILDPFAGGSVRGIIAHKLGFTYTGFDLRKEQVLANIENAQELNVEPKWIEDDSKNIPNYIADNSVDMIFTCPPYFDLEVYSDNPNDLSTMSYEKFGQVYQEIIKNCSKALKTNRFAIFVVGDIRDKKGFMVSLRDLTIQCFEKCGIKLYNEVILLSGMASASLRAETPFKVNRKLTKIHQNVLIFYKGEPNEIRQNFKELDLDY